MENDQRDFPVLSSEHRVLHCRGKVLSLEFPLVAGILNLTPDSFSDGGKHNSMDSALRHVENMLLEGADLIDVGGYSSRPGADNVSVEEEIRRIDKILDRIIREFPDPVISVDTFRSEVATATLDLGVHMINDISAGLHDGRMMNAVANASAAYVLMHMKGTPKTMQIHPEYSDVTEEILSFLQERIKAADDAGIGEVIIDPGFGFGKNERHNYEIFRNLHRFNSLDKAMMIGISGKSMISKRFGSSPAAIERIGAALHYQAMKAGARILRVHDVAATRHLVDLFRIADYGTV